MTLPLAVALAWTYRRVVALLAFFLLQLNDSPLPAEVC
jgi:hypothetical protein